MPGKSNRPRGSSNKNTLTGQGACNIFHVTSGRAEARHAKQAEHITYLIQATKAFSNGRMFVAFLLYF